MEYEQIEDRMKKVIEHLDEELSLIRAGRANPAILNKVQVEYYGVMSPINQVATISVPEARQILVTPWDRSMVSACEKAINMAELGLNPINDGNSLRLMLPELNEERRKQLVKQTKNLGEEAKVAIRNIRRDSIDEYKKMQKNSEITEDDLKSNEEDIQKITDKYTAIVDKRLEDKEKENEIIFKYKEVETPITYEALEVEFDIKEKVEKAYQVGRGSNIIKNNFEILSTWINGNKYELEASFDENVIKQVVPESMMDENTKIYVNPTGRFVVGGK